MVICKILVGNHDRKNSKLLKIYEDYSPIEIIIHDEDIDPEIPTLVYGYNLTKSLFTIDKQSPHIKNNLLWTYNEFELKNKCWVHEFVSASRVASLKPHEFLSFSFL